VAKWTKKSYPKMSRKGKKNGRWKDGSSQTHYRNKANAKSGQVVHHKDGNKKNNSRSNVKVVSKSKHNKLHPEKGGNMKSRRKRRK
jgi:hypothetical protein|tara:strand:+ start:744 stop:1001 length:258 start_codon:yes stop_codon:yes gene_type:complete